MKATQSYPSGLGSQVGLCVQEYLPVPIPDFDEWAALSESDVSSGDASDGDCLDDAMDENARATDP